MIRKSMLNKFKKKAALISAAIEKETEEILVDAEKATKICVPHTKVKNSLACIENKIAEEGMEVEFDKTMPEATKEQTKFNEETIEKICKMVTKAVVDEMEDVLKDAEEIMNEDIEKEKLSATDLRTLEASYKKMLEKDLAAKGIYVSFGRKFNKRK